MHEDKQQFEKDLNKKTKFLFLFRYVGEDYSNAQEAMEETMQCFYSQSSTHQHLSNPLVGQLVAIRGGDGDEVARAQVLEVMALDEVKVNLFIGL